MRTRSICNGALAIAVVALAAWRIACVAAGPDMDTDAYAHHMIARGILADPRDLAIHWVWLPLFHYLQVPLVAMGGTMDDVRWINVVISAVLPIVVYRYVARTAGQAGDDAAWSAGAITGTIAAVVAAACPIAMQMGTTAQPEPLFALLMFGVATTFQERRYAPAAAMLAAAAMLRYEAWASLLVIAAWCAAEPLWRRTRGLAAERDAWRAWTVVVAPVVFIAIWAILRRPVDGRWFGFLGQTRQFATGATHERSSLDRGAANLVWDALYYPAAVPVRVLGPVALLVPFGVARTVRQQGARFAAVLVACLAFVSFSWVMRSSLGLDRHFVVMVPLYAIFAAQGVGVIADATARFMRQSGRPRIALGVGRLVGGAAAAIALTGLAIELRVWMGFWRDSIVRGWPDRTAVGAYLRSIPGEPTIFCDDATIEILSGLDRRRFDRHWMDDDHTWQLIDEDARAHGVAYVATWSRKLVHHKAEGDLVFQAGQQGADPETGIGVLRVPPSVGDATR